MNFETMAAREILEIDGRLGLTPQTLQARIDRIREELAEVEAELTAGSMAAAEKEMGDVLLSTVLLAQAFPWKFNKNADFAYIHSASKVKCRLREIESRMERGESREAAIKAAKALYR